MIKLPNNFIFVPLPEGATNVRLRPGGILRWYDQHGFTAKKILPPGSYSIVCMKGDEDEDIARGIVDHEEKSEIVDFNAGGGGHIKYTVCRDYMALENGYEFDLDPIESLASLYRSLGIETAYGVIIKQL